jgi:hypothetical protein
MHTLTNENFWDKIKADYPDAFADFSKWIDDYKKEVNWELLFPTGTKFHDLPFEFQNGVLARYDIEKAVGQTYYIPGYVPGFVRLFNAIQISAEKRKQKLN